MLRTNGLSRKFRQGSRDFYAIKDTTLEIPRGALINITGRSGSGKSTFLNLIAGLLEPTTGEVYWDDRAISNLPDKEASLLRNELIGYVMQGNAALANLTALENVCLPFYLFPRKGEIKERAEQLLEQVGIRDLKNAYPAQMSGGELKRLSIARALINTPKILLADEPTGDLDAENTKGIMKLFRQIADEGTTVIVVTHELDTLSYGDCVYTMREGVLRETGL